MSDPKGIDTALLKAILTQESKRRYDNRAVIGGLDGFLTNWLNDNREELEKLLKVHQFRLLDSDSSSYFAKQIADRKRWIDNLITRIDQIEKGSFLSSAIPAKPTPSSANKKIKRPMQTAPCETLALDQHVTRLKGAGDIVAQKLARLGVQTVRDVLYFFPRKFIDFSERKMIATLETGKEQTIYAVVWEARTVMLGRIKSSEAIVGDETGNLRVVWFNQPWIARQLKPDTHIALCGRVTEFQYSRVLENPQWEEMVGDEMTGAIGMIPVYPLTQGLYPRKVRSIVKLALDKYSALLDDFVPDSVLKRCGLWDLQPAIKNAHFPSDELARNKARQRLAFDELFLLQLGVLSRRREWQQDQPGLKFDISKDFISEFIKSLPFTLTFAQQKAINDILSDLGGGVAMSRLLQGDVGSGKTVVATVAMLAAVQSGYQAAFMAPTEILAEQHFATLKKLLYAAGEYETDQTDKFIFKAFFPAEIKVGLLTGSLSSKEKSRIQQLAKDGYIDILVGTHALVQKGVEFNNLGFVIIDEQHRFGVEHRSTLRQKGFNPHMLVMTATPIPRTLALTLYGDLDISTINELPPGRKTIKTRWLNQEDRDKIYKFMRSQVNEGRQAFIICPAIEESENIDMRAAVSEYARLSADVFPDLKLGLLYGKMKAKEKEAVMQDFKEGRVNILISTSVVEVGIDVPNATVMLVEAADRFGLSQLHQFRGRVGRGEQQSFCLLLSENPSEYGQERLRAIEEINDGFQLAEKDLELRGPGEFFGTRQSGLPDLKMAKLTDTSLLEMARREARMIFEKDSRLEDPEHASIAEEIDRMWQKNMENN